MKRLKFYFLSICLVIGHFAFGQTSSITPVQFRANTTQTAHIDPLVYNYAGKIGGPDSIYTKYYIDRFFGLQSGTLPGGLVTTISGSNAVTTAGSWIINGVRYSKGTSTTTTLEAQDATQYREDILYATTSNTILKATGVLGSDYTAPALPDNTLEIADIFIPPTGSSTTVTPPTQTPIYTTGNQLKKGILTLQNQLVIRGGIKYQTLPATPTSQIGYLVLNSDGTTALSSSAGTGTVTSVAISGTAGIIVVSGSPITTNGTIALKGDTGYFTTKALIGNYQTKAQNIASYYPLTSNPSGFITNTGSTSGNAGTATKLATARTINGTSFDGTANITITASTPNSITFNTSGGAAAGSIFNGGSALIVSPVTIGAQPQLSGTGFVKATGTTISYDNSTYITGNQSITLSGDVSGTGTTAITTTLANTGVTAGTCTNCTVTFDAKGRATSASSGSAGLTNPMTTPGDIIYGITSGSPARLAIGGANTVLHGGTSAPSYSGVAIGDILATGTPSATTFLEGDGKWASIAVSGTTNYIAKFTSGSAIGSSSQIYDDGAGIMLGTTVNSGFQFDQTGTFRSQGNFGIGKVTNPVPFSYAGATTGGTLAAATYYYKIVAVDQNFQETNPSSEINATVSSGTTGSVNIQWTAVTGASSYHVYRGTSAGSETGYLSTSLTNFTDVGGGLTTQAVPTLNKSAVTWFLTDGTINGYRFGYGPGTATNTNLVIGSGTAMGHNTSGSGIVALGVNTLAQNTTGATLIAIGYNALSNETINGQSIAIGYSAGSGVTTGQYDLFIGHNSGGANSSFNIGIGSQALQNSTGGQNVGIGVNIGYYNTTGANNVLTGYQTGMFYGGSTSNHTTAIDNSVLEGYQVMPNGNSETNEIAIGYSAVGKGSNTAILGNSSITDTYLQGVLHLLSAPSTGAIGTDLIAVYNTSANSIKTISATAFAIAVTTTDITSNTSGAVANRYVANSSSRLVITLPSTANEGDVMFVVGKGSGGWQVGQNSGQVIHGNASDTTVGAGGNLQSQSRYNCVELRCVVANTDWTIVNSNGSLTSN